MLMGSPPFAKAAVLLGMFMLFSLLSVFPCSDYAHTPEAGRPGGEEGKAVALPPSVDAGSGDAIPAESPTPSPVSFSLAVAPPSGCGLTCRETIATITNTGDQAAHTVCVTLEVFNEQGERIYVNGQQSIERCMGDLEGHASRSEHVRIEADCGLFALKCVGHTLLLKVRVTSQEAVQQFPEQQIRV